MSPHHTGAILQRDGKSYAIVTRIPAGIVTPDDLELIAGVARKYRVPIVRITSGQRFALVGLDEKDVPAIWRDLGGLSERETAPCIRYVQTCLGTGTCKYGNQDSIGLGLDIEGRYHGAVFPAKLKIGVSGCPRCCGESFMRDIGVIGTKRGWTVTFGGNSGRRPRIGTSITDDLTSEEALDLVQRLLEYYRTNAEPQERTARFIERIGFERLKSDLLTLLPYISLDDAR
jgi:NAD(P)H-nitrite reductase large subunit